MNEINKNSPWVLVDIAGNIYAITTNSVLSLNQLPKSTPIPKAPPEVRGVIDFRGNLIELLDTRTLLGIKTIATETKEFSDMMDARLKDHLNWIDTLEKCVKEDTAFTLTTDHHKCAFGKWYDAYDVKKNKNIMFLTTYARFDAPHQAIHGIAIKAKALIDKSGREAAIDLIESVRHTELVQMVGLFDEIKTAYAESKREIVVVLGDEKHAIGIAVDDIVAIEPLTEFDENLIKETITSTEYLTGIAKRKNKNSVMLLNDEFICRNFKK